MAGVQRITYAKMLSNWIEDSGLTLRQLSEKCRELGKYVSFAYIGKLRTGEAESPSVDVTQILAKALDKDPNALITLQLLERLSPEWQDMYWAVLNVWGVKTDTEAGMTLEKIRAAMLMAQQAAQLPQGESVKYFLPVLEEPPDVPHDGTELTPDDLKSDHLMEVPPDLSRGAQYVLRARGTAYADIGAWPGDYLLIGRTGTRTGYSVLVKIGDVVTARRYYEQPKPFQLEPAFLNGMPIDHRKVVFLGVVHGLIRHM